MKRLITLSGWLVVAAALIIGTAACSKDDIISEDQPVNPAAQNTYTLTVTASKGGDDATTRALILDNKTLNAAWTVGEQVTVYNVTKSADLGGYLEAQTAGTNTTLKGTLTGTIENGDELTLKFLSPDYAIQDGTLEYIAAHCDYAEATVTVSSTNGSVTTTDANFTNQQAIVKFTLKNSGGSPISASALSVQVNGIPYTVVPASAIDTFTVAVPGFSGKTVELFAKVGSDWYSYERAGVVFANGKYYTVGVKMAQTGTLPGTFTVGSGGTMARFSQGNLKYTSSWSFHTNQYDMIGDYQDNDYRDLFGWGTGSNPNKTSLYGSYSPYSEWGSNLGSEWYTLTTEEWQYLFNNHTYGWATVNSIHGVIVLPDGYSGAAVTAGSGSRWNTNTPDASTWAAMEAAGAVFLPAAGQRSGEEIHNVGSYGYYWSSTGAGESWAYDMHFDKDGLNANSHHVHGVGYSVRLVRSFIFNANEVTRALINSMNAQRTGYGTVLNAQWKAGDEVKVYKGETYLGSLTAASDGASTTLSGEICGEIAVNDDLTLKFLSGDYATQTGTLTYINEHCDYAVATVKITAIGGGSVTTEDAVFANQQAIVKFTLQNSGSSAISASALSVQADGNTYTLIPASTTSEVYVAVPGFSDKTVELFAKVGTSWYSKATTSISFSNGQYYTVTVGLTQTGALPGKFTVGSNQVRFSQGNLMYDGSNWSFHSNQYDRVFTDDDIATSYPMDLFTWGNISTPAYDGDSYVNGVSNLNGSNDWGSNLITNGGGTANYGWRTLSRDEWIYLFEYRSASTVNGTANARCVCAQIAGTNSVILFPDNYTHPKDVASPTNINPALYSAHWDDNLYTAEEWAKMETAGAVLLPDAGRRYRGSIFYMGGNGGYWSSSAENLDGTCAFTVVAVNPSSSNYRHNALSVRLARNVD